MSKRILSTKKIISIATFIIACVLMVFFGIFFLKPKETYISNNSDTKHSNVLHCKSNNPKNPFFHMGNERNTIHDIKILFKNSVINNFFYSYEGEYDNNADADVAMSWMHADYNIYLGDNGLAIEDYDAKFSTIDNTVKVNIYIDEDKITTPGVEKFTFLESNTLKNYSIRDLETQYTNEGFSCVIN